MKNLDSRLPGYAVALLSLCVVGCAQGPASVPPSAPEAQARSVATPSELLRGASVTGIYEGTAVTLRDGVYAGEPFVAGGASRPTVTLLERMTVQGELDGSPGEEIAALLAESSGGSGEMIYVAVFATSDGTLSNLGTAAVGDRVRLRRIQIDDGAVVLDVVQPGPREPRCCGTQLARKAYRLESGGLREVASQAVGRLSLATIARIEWQLEEMNGRPPAPGSQVPTFEISGDTASGFGGCNRYSGAIKESAPGRISLGDLASTRMACGDEQMALEDEYLRDLRKVSSYTFLAGSLALEWHDGDQHGLLVFRRRE